MHYWFLCTAENERFDGSKKNLLLFELHGRSTYSTDPPLPTSPMCVKSSLLINDAFHTPHPLFILFQNEEKRNLSLGGHVGFDSLPDQLVSKSVTQGFCFNILCVGECFSQTVEDKCVLWWNWFILVQLRFTESTQLDDCVISVISVLAVKSEDCRCRYELQLVRVEALLTSDTGTPANNLSAAPNCHLP